MLLPLTEAAVGDPVEWCLLTLGTTGLGCDILDFCPLVLVLAILPLLMKLDGRSPNFGKLNWKLLEL